jgi:hypothetical protein
LEHVLDNEVIGGIADKQDNKILEQIAQEPRRPAIHKVRSTEVRARKD